MIVGNHIIPEAIDMSQPIDAITDRIIGCCFKVHGVLGAGFVERVYENALMIEMAKQGLTAQQQVPINKAKNLLQSSYGSSR